MSWDPAGERVLSYVEELATAQIHRLGDLLPSQRQDQVQHQEQVQESTPAPVASTTIHAQLLALEQRLHDAVEDLYSGENVSRRVGFKGLGM